MSQFVLVPNRNAKPGQQDPPMNLFCEGYKYTFHKKAKNSATSYWRCSDRSCQGRGILKEDEFTVTKNHDKHLPDPGKLPTSQMAYHLKAQAAQSIHTSTQHIFEAVRTKVQDEHGADVIEDLPSYHTSRNIMYRARMGVCPPEPLTRDELILDGEWSNTKEGEVFLMGDTADTDRILMFSTNRNLDNLCSSTNWHVDGTYTGVPKLYVQLLTIYTDVSEKMIPLVYFLLPEKSKRVYVKAFGMLRDKIEELGIDFAFFKPELHSDFECEMISGFQDTFPDSQHSSCFFHFARASFQKLQELGLHLTYLSDRSFASFYRQFLAIAFLPEKCVPHAWSGLKANAPASPKINELIEHIEDTWMGAKAPFPPEQWNQHHNTGPKTDYHLESWQSMLSKRFSRKPRFFRLVSELRESE